MAQELEEIINSVVDLKNGRKNILQIVPGVTIRRCALSDADVAKYKDVLENIKHLEPALAKNYFKELADRVVADRVRRKNDWYSELDEGHAKMLNRVIMDQDTYGPVRIFGLYYGSFFRRPEHDIHEIAHRLHLTKEYVREQLGIIDKDYFNPTQAFIDSNGGKYRRERDPKIVPRKLA